MELKEKLAQVEELLNNNQYEDCIKEGELLLQENSTSVRLMQIIASAYFANNNTRHAKYHLYNSLDIEPNNYTSKSILVKVFLAKEQYAEAESVFESIIAENPNDFYALRSLGDIKLKKGFDLVAVDYYEKALNSPLQILADQEAIADALTKAISIYLNNNHKEKAIERLKNTEYTGFNEALFLIKRTLYISFNERYLDELKSCVERLHEHAPDNMMYLTDLAQMYRAEDNSDKLIATYDKIFAQNLEEDQHTLVLEQRGSFFIEKEKWAEAIADFKQLLEKEEKVGYYQQLAFAREESGDIKNAILDLTKAMKIAGDEEKYVLAPIDKASNNVSVSTTS